MAEKKILIVDDDRDIRVGLNTRLQSSGYETVLAEDGAGATACARREQPDVILLDIGLPAGDGFVVLERLKEMPGMGATPVIVITARDPEPTEKKALDAGAFAFFTKPLENEKLLAAIERALAAS